MAHSVHKGIKTEICKLHQGLTPILGRFFPYKEERGPIDALSKLSVALGL